MLVLSRSKGQGVCFPALGVRIDVLAVVGRKVKLGVDAPREILALRTELLGAQPPPPASNRTAVHDLAASVKSCLERIENQGEISLAERADINDLLQLVASRLSSKVKLANLQPADIESVDRTEAFAST